MEKIKSLVHLMEFLIIFTINIKYVCYVIHYYYFWTYNVFCFAAVMPPPSSPPVNGNTIIMLIFWIEIPRIKHKWHIAHSLLMKAMTKTELNAYVPINPILHLKIGRL